jgi:hypothetical protein
VVPLHVRVTREKKAQPAILLAQQEILVEQFSWDQLERKLVIMREAVFAIAGRLCSC